MRRVVITGIGIVSPIGNSAAEVDASLRAGRSGIRFEPTYAEHGFRSQVAGIPQIDLAESIDKRQLRFMGATAAYAYLAMEQAVADSGLTEAEVSNERTGLVAGSGGPSTSNFFTAFDTVITKGAPKKMGPFMVTRCMSSTVSACLATPFRIKGINYSITSACSTSAHCIGNGAEQIQMGKQDIVFAGGGEEVDWTLSCLFDAMGAMSSKYNDAPETAARAYDATRDGFVIGGGASRVINDGTVAASANKPFWLQLVGTGITATWGMHLAAVLTHCRWPAINCNHLFEHELIEPAIRVENGTAAIPEGPGLGVELDEDAVARYRIEPLKNPRNPPANILLSIRFPSGATSYYVSAAEYRADFLAGKLPVFPAGIYLEEIPNNGSAAWKELHARAVKGGFQVGGRPL